MAKYYAVDFYAELTMAVCPEHAVLWLVWLGVVWSHPEVRGQGSRVRGRRCVGVRLRVRACVCGGMCYLLVFFFFGRSVALWLGRDPWRVLLLAVLCVCVGRGGVWA